MKQNVFLKMEEIKFIALATIAQLEDLRNAATDEKIPWTPESRKTIKEMREAGEAVKIKLQKLGFDMSDLPELYPGEEDEYLTKES